MLTLRWCRLSVNERLLRGQAVDAIVRLHVEGVGGGGFESHHGEGGGLARDPDRGGGHPGRRRDGFAQATVEQRVVHDVEGRAIWTPAQHHLVRAGGVCNGREVLDASECCEKHVGCIGIFLGGSIDVAITRIKNVKKRILRQANKRNVKISFVCAILFRAATCSELSHSIPSYYSISLGPALPFAVCVWGGGGVIL